jgi:large conductance mechanosensitive channel
MDFSALTMTLQKAGVNNAGEPVAAVNLNYGRFIQTVIDFLIIAFSIFIVVRTANRLKKNKEEAATAPPAPSKEEVLLTEIRDALRARG